MRINWFKDETHLIYINGETQLGELEQTVDMEAIVIIQFIYLYSTVSSSKLV